MAPRYKSPLDPRLMSNSDLVSEGYARGYIGLKDMERILDNLWGIKDPMRSLDQERAELQRLECMLLGIEYKGGQRGQGWYVQV